MLLHLLLLQCRIWVLIKLSLITKTPFITYGYVVDEKLDWGRDWRYIWWIQEQTIHLRSEEVPILLHSHIFGAYLRVVFI